MATRVEMRRAYELYAGLTRSYETTFEVSTTQLVSHGEFAVVDPVLHGARRAEITWLRAIVSNRKRMNVGSWALIGRDASRTLAVVTCLFQLDGVTYVALHMYPALALAAAEGCGKSVFAVSDYALHNAAVVPQVQPLHTLRMALLHSRQHRSSMTTRFIVSC